MMNLLVNRPLDQAEKQLIYELTLKKRKSKKCHMSASQMLARQQLARELLPHLRMGPMDSVDTINTTYTSSMLGSQSLDDKSLLLYEQSPTLNNMRPDNITGPAAAMSTSSGSSMGSGLSSGSISSGCFCSSSSSGSGASKSSSIEAACLGSSAAADSNLMCCSLGSSGCSFSRSDSSYSGSSQASGGSHQQHHHHQLGAAEMASAAADELSRQTELELEEARKANIKLNKSKLEQLNEALERRLYQYQYLVAQEKALLGTYNMMLFTNEGVNNFHNMRNVPLKPD